MRQNIQELVDAGYVGELFPSVVEGNHGSEDIDDGEEVEASQEEGLDFSKEWYYCASGNAIRNHLPCDECIKSEPREGIHCIRFFKLHPCAYFNSAHCNGSTCEYWDPKTITCTYGPYVATLAPAPSVAPAKTKKQPKPTKEPIAAGNFVRLQQGRGADGKFHFDASRCLMSECNGWRWYHFEVLEGIRDWVMDNGRNWHTGLRIGELAAEVPAKEPIALLLNGKWYSAGKMLWDCSDCLCLDCANEGKSCHDCKGFERCMKIGGTGGKIGACPDFRTEEGKEQHCLENGCLCFKCQLIGEDNCEKCPGPIRCAKPRTKCKGYVGAETDHIRLTVSPDKKS